jgi:hypothetical protein
MKDGRSKRILKFGVRVAEILSFPVLLLSGTYLKILRSVGLSRLAFSRDMLTKLGVFPIIDHYYEPLFNPAHLSAPLDTDRQIGGLDMNEVGQLQLLSEFRFEEELREFGSFAYKAPVGGHGPNTYFCGGDADFYYSIIRLRKPKRIIEIGSGYSTLVALQAIKKNRMEDPSYTCEVTCIEPYSNNWLDQLGIRVLRQRVENVDLGFFSSLDAGDILFIDSSHMIRPQGDVQFEYFQILPALSKGVLIHIHDIFTPKEYPDDWFLIDRRFWNEQYLVEAFLCFNREFRIIAALHFLFFNHLTVLQCHLPHLEEFPAKLRSLTPGSLWLERV